jgi:chromosome segregation ATPase
MKVSEDAKAYEDKIKVLEKEILIEKGKSDEIQNKLNAEIEAHKKSTTNITNLEKAQGIDKKALVDAATKLKTSEENSNKLTEELKTKNDEIGRLAGVVVEKDKEISAQKVSYDAQIVALNQKITAADNDSKLKLAQINKQQVDSSAKDVKIVALEKEVTDLNTKIGTLQQNGG